VGGFGEEGGETREGLKILYLNAQSILSKIPDLEATASDCLPDLILITESWCNNSICDNVLSLCNYELVSELRKDRNDTTDGRGGGLLVYKYARKELVVLPVDNPSDFNQYCNFKVLTNKSEVNVILVYRPPTCSAENRNKLNMLIKDVPKNTVIIGDLNYPNINWSNLTSDNSSRVIFKCLSGQ